MNHDLNEIVDEIHKVHPEFKSSMIYKDAILFFDENGFPCAQMDVKGFSVNQMNGSVSVIIDLFEYKNKLMDGENNLSSKI